MNYKKPTIIAQNKAKGSFAAGCPSNFMGSDYHCRQCDRTK